MIKNNPTLQVGDVVQIDPENKMFGACFMVITEIKPWGAQGYIQVPGEGEAGGRAYYRAKFEEMVYIGVAEWRFERKEEEQ